MDQATGESSCGGAVISTIFGTIIVIVLVAVGLWVFYTKYWKRKLGLSIYKKKNV